ncbi:LPS assembly protein LptD [Corallococcus sp. M34]|uniref:LPS-assembly protein LptD n=1 Tax=Citreicoccus inhibens TaxID=2849499 RepID=UPI001C23AC01|nr:LPS assembly protein LptD [Citreicoccus inhibens]MBU8900564.1 LPS assembly protein LptD [Citreicoccus inhibens]
MTSLVPVALALLVSTQLPLATQVQLPSGETVELAADYVVYDSDTQHLTARGHCELRSGDNLLRADEVTYDEAAQVATASGNVMFVSGGMAAVAESVRMDLAANEAVVQGGLFMQKKGVTLEALLAAKTPEELRSLGQTPVLMSGTHIKRTAPNAFVVDDLAFTPCECGPGEPSWRVEANEASVVMGERAILTWPVVYVRSVPVFALPWLYLPLSSRRTGLLIPKPTTSSLNGFALDAPFFITLGESYDMTLTPGYFSGGKVVKRELPARIVGTENLLTVIRREPRVNGVKGPRLLTEFRYVPSEHTRGRVTLGFLQDSHPRVDPRFDPRLSGGDFFRLDETEGGLVVPEYIHEKRGLRGEASWQHTQDLGGGWHDRVDASFVSDGFYTRDLTADLIAREQNYLRSTGVIYQRQDELYAGLDVSLRQDLRWPFRFFQDNRLPAALDPARPEIPGPSTFQRLPGLTFVLPERPIWGGLVSGLRMEFSRLTPLLSRYGDFGVDGQYTATGRYRPPGDLLTVDPKLLPMDPGQSNGVFDTQDREARDRLDFNPRITGSFDLGGVARVTPSLALRQDFFVGEQSGRTQQRGYPIANLRLDSQLERTFAGLTPTSTYRHTVSPSVELRYVPVGWGRVPAAGASAAGSPQRYDEIDAAVPLQSDGHVRGFLQAVVAVDQALSVKTGNFIREPLRLRLGQGFDLSRHAPVAGRSELTRAIADGTMTGSVLRDSFARLSASAGILTAGALVRLDPTTGDITQLAADFSIDNGKGDGLYARYDDLLAVRPLAIERGLDPLAVGPDSVRRGIDMLVGEASRSLPEVPDLPDRSAAERAQALTAGTRITLGFGLGLRYEALVQPLYRDPTTQESQPLAQQTFAVSYGPACNCWRVEGVMILRRGQSLEFAGVNLSIAGFGSFGSGG